MNRTPDPQAEKAAIRARTRAAVASMTPQQKATESALICDRLQKLDLYNNARVIMMFVPLPDEPLIEPLARHAISRGKMVVIPRPDWHDNTMVAALVQDWTTDITKNFKGFPVPLEDAPTYDPDSINCILVPGLAFTITGVRLGRGGGFYDRYLAQIPIHKRVGLCYRCQLVDHIPLMPHDETMGEVITG